MIAGDAASMSGGAAAGFGVLGNAGVTQYMATTGGRGDIGPTTQANTIWLMTQNAQAQAFALAQADAAGSVPWHLYGQATGTYLATTQYPALWADPRGGSTWGTTGLTQPVPDYYSDANPGSGWTVDTGHQPDLSYDAYLLTGSRYYLDQLNAQASYDILEAAPSWRQDGQDLVVNGASQVRVQAWDLRQLQEAAFINPDNAPLKAYFIQAVNNNFTNLLAAIIPPSTAAEGQAAGWLPGTYGTANSMAPWQQDYFGQVVAMAAEQGNAQAQQVLHWESNYLVGRFLQASNGLDPHDGVAYNMVVSTASGSLYQSWAQIEQATTAAGLGANFSGQWAALEYPGYQAWALATLAGDITVEQSPQALQAYGWLEANDQVNAAWQAASPLYDIVPRLADGNLLTSPNVHILTGSASQNAAFGNADQLVYDNGSGNTTISGGAGINILFAGNGQDLLIGGAGDDFLFGGSGAATLSGGAGHNWLQAGSGGAQFNLATADAAQDVIAGFTPGRDHLHLTGSGGVPLTTPQIQSLIAGATSNAGNTTLTLSPTHTVTINNLAPAQLNQAAFVVTGTAEVRRVGTAKAGRPREGRPSRLRGPTGALASGETRRAFSDPDGHVERRQHLMVRAAIVHALHALEAPLARDLPQQVMGAGADPARIGMPSRRPQRTHRAAPSVRGGVVALHPFLVRLDQQPRAAQQMRGRGFEELGRIAGEQVLNLAHPQRTLTKGLGRTDPAGRAVRGRRLGGWLERWGEVATIKGHGFLQSDETRFRNVTRTVAESARLSRGTHPKAGPTRPILPLASHPDLMPATFLANVPVWAKFPPQDREPAGRTL